MNDLQEFTKELYKQSFLEFFKAAWEHIEGATPLKLGRHIYLLCDHLEALQKRQIKNLLINIPPRTGKSTLISIAYTAWVWTHSPHEKFMFASYAQSLSLKHSTECRRLIESHWYKTLFGDSFSLSRDQNTKGRFDNNQHGYRIATSINGSVTGEGASILVCDDPNSTRSVESKKVRESTIDFWTKAWSTRLNDKRNDCRLVVQQRSNQGDVSGYIMANDSEGEWTQLILPMEFESSKRCVTSIGSDWRKKEGELLWPEQIGEKELLSLKNDLGSTYAIAGQLQQRPSPVTGGIIKRDWFVRYERKIYPAFTLVIQSWDTAITDKPTSAYSACTTWGVFEDEDGIKRVMLLSTWRGRVLYPELRKRATRLFKDYLDTGDKETATHRRCDKVLIEAKATGDPLVRDFRQAGIQAIGYPVRGDKESRVQRISHLIELGYVLIPCHIRNPERFTVWGDEFIEHAVLFPNAESNDFIDTMSQVLQYLVDYNALKPAKVLEKYR